MQTAEFLKRYQDQLDGLAFGLGEKIAGMLEEKDERILELTNYYKSLERALHNAQYPEPADLSKFPEIDTPVPKDDYYVPINERCSIGRENRRD